MIRTRIAAWLKPNWGVLLLGVLIAFGLVMGAWTDYRTHRSWGKVFREHVQSVVWGGGGGSSDRGPIE